MTRRTRIPDSDLAGLADLDEAYNRVCAQRQWDAIAQDPEPRWAGLVLAILVLVAGAGTVLYVLGWGWS